MTLNSMARYPTAFLHNQDPFETWQASTRPMPKTMSDTVRRADLLAEANANVTAQGR